MAKKVLVVVMGDLARSPRMQYHCISLAKERYEVTVIANGGGPSADKCCELLESNNNIKQRLMQHNNIDFKSYLPSILAYLLKTIWQSILLILQLSCYFLKHRANFILVQNPPSIPTLPLLYIYSRLFRCNLVIDWHNYGFTIFAMNTGSSRSKLVILMRFIELHFGRLADAGFCVSRAMQKTLIRDYHMTYPIHVLYDKPPSQFKPLNDEQKSEFVNTISSQMVSFKGFDMKSSTRPAIIMTSTSWTEDEDFDILLEALRYYESKVNSRDLICVITGKGPLKSHYENEIRKLRFKHVRFELPWLKAEDYPKMVGSCDIGISLHKSSSGDDLPMKVVDFFGCGIPVLAYKYKAINELVIDGKYGETFHDSRSLFDRLKMLVDFQSGDRDKLNQFRKNIINEFLELRWDDHWTQVAKPLLATL